MPLTGAGVIARAGGIRSGGRKYRGSALTAGMTARWLAPVAAVAICLALGGCSSFSGFVADTWPTWAGGMPKDVPPRPGAPGYEEFIAHQQRQDAAPNAAATPAAASGATAATTAAPTAVPATTATLPRPAGNATPPPPPAYTRPDDRSAAQGGLY
jgi:hypothetical protein